MSHCSENQSTKVVIFALWKEKQSWKRPTWENMLCPLEIPIPFSGVRFPQPNRERKAHIPVINSGMEAGQECLLST